MAVLAARWPSERTFEIAIDQAAKTNPPVVPAPAEYVPRHARATTSITPEHS